MTRLRAEAHPLHTMLAEPQGESRVAKLGLREARTKPPFARGEAAGGLRLKCCISLLLAIEENVRGDSPRYAI